MSNFQTNNRDKSMTLNSVLLVKFRVNDGTNYEVTIPAKPTDTILTLKQQLDFLYKIPINTQKFLFKGQILADSNMISSYKYSNNDVIYLDWNTLQGNTNVVVTAPANNTPVPKPAISAIPPPPQKSNSTILRGAVNSTVTAQVNTTSPTTTPTTSTPTVATDLFNNPAANNPTQVQKDLVGRANSYSAPPKPNMDPYKLPSVTSFPNYNINVGFGQYNYPGFSSAYPYPGAPSVPNPYQAYSFSSIPPQWSNPNYTAQLPTQFPTQPTTVSQLTNQQVLPTQPTGPSQPLNQPVSQPSLPTQQQLTQPPSQIKATAIDIQQPIKIPDNQAKTTDNQAPKVGAQTAAPEAVKQTLNGTSPFRQSIDKKPKKLPSFVWVPKNPSTTEVQTTTKPTESPEPAKETPKLDLPPKAPSRESSASKVEAAQPNQYQNVKDFVSPQKGQFRKSRDFSPDAKSLNSRFRSSSGSLGKWVPKNPQSAPEGTPTKNSSKDIPPQLNSTFQFQGTTNWVSFAPTEMDQRIEITHGHGHHHSNSLAMPTFIPIPQPPSTPPLAAPAVESPNPEPIPPLAHAASIPRIPPPMVNKRRPSTGAQKGSVTPNESPTSSPIPPRSSTAPPATNTSVPKPAELPVTQFTFQPEPVPVRLPTGTNPTDKKSSQERNGTEPTRTPSSPMGWLRSSITFVPSPGAFPPVSGPSPVQTPTPTPPASPPNGRKQLAKSIMELQQQNLNTIAVYSPPEPVAVSSPVESPSPQSPTRVDPDVTDARFCCAYGNGISEAIAGNPSSFIIQAKDGLDQNRSCGGDSFVVLLHGPSFVQATVSDLGNGLYHCEYVLQEKGLYDMFVGVNGIQIAGSPFSVIVSPSTTYGPQCIILGAGNFAAGSASQFYIQARDLYGNNRDSGGDVFEVVLQGPELVEGTVVDDNNGSYTVHCSARIAGLYELTVSHGGYHIMGSPFKTIVTPSETCAIECMATGLGLSGGITGVPAEFFIQSVDKFGNKRTSGGDLFRVAIKDGNKVLAYGQVRDQGTGSYSVSYKVQCIGSVLIAVELNGAHIKGSPFIANIVAGIGSAKTVRRAVSSLSVKMNNLPPYEKKVILAQSCVRRYLTKKMFTAVLHNYRFRTKVATEILTSEQSYLEQIDTLKELFMDPLRQSLLTPRPIITTDKIGLIFSNINFIRAINGELYAKLEQRLNNWSPAQNLGDIFVEKAPSLQYSYSHYVNNYDQALKALSYCQEKEPAFATFLESRSHKVHPKLGILHIDALLIAPVQRLPRYTLLLKELIKYTPAEHQDYDQLNVALNKIKDITEFVNTNKKKAENLQKIISIQTSLEGSIKSLFHLNRILVNEGSFLVMTGSAKKSKHRYLYLFNDVLLITSVIQKGNKSRKYEDTVQLQRCYLQPPPQDAPQAFRILGPKASYAILPESSRPEHTKHFASFINDLKEAILAANSPAPSIL